jgi:hypothetical protein
MHSRGTSKELNHPSRSRSFIHSHQLLGRSWSPRPGRFRAACPPSSWPFDGQCFTVSLLLHWSPSFQNSMAQLGQRFLSGALGSSTCVIICLHLRAAHLSSVCISLLRSGLVWTWGTSGRARDCPRHVQVVCALVFSS